MIKHFLFDNRMDAGHKLASRLCEYKDRKDVIVLGLPRGGVVTGFAVAEDLHLPLDIVVPRKIGAPFNKEFAVGAITEDGKPEFNQEYLQMLGLSPRDLHKEVLEQTHEAQRRVRVYRGDRPPLDLHQKEVLVVDDGIATGSTTKAALSTIKSKHPKKVIVCTPVIPPENIESIAKLCDKIIYLAAPQGFRAVGQFYREFNQTEDDEVISLLHRNYESVVGNGEAMEGDGCILPKECPALRSHSCTDFAH